MTILSQLWKSGHLNWEYRLENSPLCARNSAFSFFVPRNSDRSIFAEYFLRSLAGDRFEVYSAAEVPSGEVHPLVLKILSDNFNTDAMDARSKPWQEFKDLPFDFVITVADDERERSPVVSGAPVTAHWSIPDPLAFEESDDERYQRLLQTAFQVKRRIELFASLPVEKLDYLQRQRQTRQIHDTASEQQS